MSKPDADSPVLTAALSHFAAHRGQHLRDLCDLVRIPSISFPGFPPEQVRRSADATARILMSRGFENVRTIDFPGGLPYVYGERLHAPGKPTLLLYAHHDVQPVGDEAAWKTPPFEPTQIGDRLFGRGSADDKAGIIVHTAALASYLGSGGEAPLNLKLLVEGEEEAGSTTLDAFLAAHFEMLRADAMVLTDTGNFDVGIPSVTTSLRGLCTLEVEVSSLRQPVHSGMWGGPLPDAGMALSKILASLTTPDGRIAVPGVYDRIRPLSRLEEESFAALPHDPARFRDQSGLHEDVPFLGEGTEWQNPWVAIWRQPSVAVNAVEISSRREARNVINGSAWARIGLRLVPDMDPAESEQALIDHVRKAAPHGVRVDIRKLGTNGPWHVNPEHPAFAAAARALERGYGQRAVFIGSGGSIPFVAPLSERMGGIPALLIGVEDPYTNAHSENESLCLPDWESAIRSAIYLYDDLARSL